MNLNSLIKTEIDLSEVWNPVTCRFDPSTVKGVLLGFWWVTGVEKKPAITSNGVMVEQYHYTVTHWPRWNAGKIIKNVVFCYSERERYELLRDETFARVVSWFKTGAHYYMQYIAGDTPENRVIRDEYTKNWKRCGQFERVIAHDGCGWIYAYAVRRLKDSE